MRAASSPSRVQTLLEREATALRDKVLQRCPAPTLAEGHFSGGSPLKARVVTHSPPPALPGGNLSGGVSLQAEKEQRAGERAGHFRDWHILNATPLALLPRRSGRSH